MTSEQCKPTVKYCKKMENVTEIQRFKMTVEIKDFMANLSVYLTPEEGRCARKSTNMQALVNIIRMHTWNI